MRKGQSSDGALGPEWIFLLYVCTGQSYRLPSRTVPWTPAWGSRDPPWVAGSAWELPLLFTGEMLLVGPDASLPWLLWVHKRSMRACCALWAPGPEWLLGLPMRSWRAERCCALCCELYTGDVFFLKCCDACWVLPVAPRGSEDPYKCHKIVCLVTQTILRGLWVRAELQTSGLNPLTPQPQC